MIGDDMEPRTLKSNEYWGRRSGKYVAAHPKGCDKPWGFVFQQQQWGGGGNRNARQRTVKLINVNKRWFA